MIRFRHLLVIGLAAIALAGKPASAQTSYTGGTYQQNFDSLANTGSPAWNDNTTLVGWYSNKAVYSVGTGSSNAGAIYSFGASGSNERALGSVASSGSGTLLYGVRIRNNTGGTLTSFTLSYNGEQWRNGNNATQHKLAVSTSQDATDITTGTFTNRSQFDFVGPVATTTAGALDGNSNRVAISSTLTGLTWANGTDLWIRWLDPDDSGNDHGLAIDDLSFSAAGESDLVPEPGSFQLLLPVLLAGILIARRRPQPRPARVAGRR